MPDNSESGNSESGSSGTGSSGTSHSGSAAATVEVVPGDGGEVIIRLGGEIDVSTVGPLESAVESALAGAPPTLTFDLADVAFMDSSGLALLVGTAARVPTVRVAHPSPLIRRVIELSGLASTLPILP